MSGGASEFKRGIWAEALLECWKNILFIMLIIVTFFVLAFAGLPAWSIYAAYAWLAIRIQASLLNGTNPSMLDVQRRYLPFIWRSIVLVLPSFAAKTLISDTSGSVINIDSLHLAAAVATAVTAIIFGIAGTWLPAVVAEGGIRTFTAAIERGRRVFGYSLFRFIVCCGPIALAGMILVIESAWVSFDVAAKLGLMGFVVLSMISWVLMEFVNAFMIVMFTVILARAYQIAEGYSHPKQ